MRQALFPSLTFCLLTLGLLAGQARAQEGPKPEGAQANRQPAPRASDVASVESIVAAVYDVISGPAGQKRDWERMRSLFVPGARMIPTSPVRPPGAKPDAPPTGSEPYAANALDVEGYVARASKFFEESGFFERETARRVETYGHIAHVWSTYESRHHREDPEPFARGINSIQLMNDGRRWWVVTIFWEAETPRTPIPKQYLRSAP